MSAGIDSDGGIRKKSGRYWRIRYTLVIAETLYLLLLLFLFLNFRLSQGLASDILKLKINGFFILPLYLLIVFIAYYILNFFFAFYHSFILEHQFALSRQTIRDWFCDQLKSGVISYILGIIVLESFYFILARYPGGWWWRLAIFWIFFSLIVARLAPVAIIPLFFKYKKFSDSALKDRIIGLAERMKIKILDVFEIDLSKKTAKANAGLLGWGRTRRVILADTLREKYTPDEILVILAHEFAHYKLKHLIKLIVLSATNTTVCFYLIFKTSPYALKILGLSSLKDVESLPLVFIYLVLFGIITRPLENFFSRRFERNADHLAVKSTGLKEAFISTMEKLARQNLSDRSVQQAIKFFFFDHPPVDERIAAAKTL
jgi:STE24 endopeptidase